jgi:hypothetical protein
MAKYAEERDKRLRSDATGQYIDLESSTKYGNFLEDPWIDAGTPVNTPVANDGHCKVVIMGAGLGVSSIRIPLACCHAKVCTLREGNPLLHPPVESWTLRG